MNVLVVDLEATCWKGSPPPGEESEIIEIGVASLDFNNGEIFHQSFVVKPEKSSISEFCTKLTTIDDELIDMEGISFKEATERIEAKYNSKRKTWASWGHYDLRMMTQECEKKSVDFPFGKNHLNIKDLFSIYRNTRKGAGQGKALRILKKEFIGVPHRAHWDAYNAARVLYHIITESSQLFKIKH